jgi:hypothetical protein
MRSILQRSDPALLTEPEQLGARPGSAARGVDRAHRSLLDGIAEGALEREIAKWTLKRRSSWGFNGTPYPLPPCRLRPTDIVCSDPSAPIEWARVRNELWVAAHGQLIHVPWSRPLEALLRRANSGAPARVASLVDSVATADLRPARRLLQHLVRSRGLQIA